MTDAGQTRSLQAMIAPSDIAGPRQWYMLFVLTMALLLGMIDRFALAPLVEPVKADLGITDQEMSLLIGASFALFYSLIGLFAGHLVDRFNRRNLILAGLVIWTSMTFASAFAPSYGWLFLFRSGVGVGEAVLSPAIYSMLRDSFPPSQRSLAFGINNLGSPLGNALGLIIIGGLSGMAAGGSLSALPVIGDLHTWRTVLAVIGLCGIPFGLLLLTIAEPARSGEARPDEATVGAVWRHFRANMAAYLLLYGSTTFYGVGFYGLTAWMPTALTRAWGVPIPTVAPQLGSIQVVAAPAGMLLAGFLISRMARSGGDRLIGLAGAVAMVLCGLAVGSWAAASSPAAAWTAIAVVLMLTPWSGIAVMTLISNLTHPRMMGKIAAVNFLLLSLVGMAFGPWLNPMLAETLFTGPRAMLHGTGLGSGLAMAGSGLCLFLSRRFLMQVSA